MGFLYIKLQTQCYAIDTNLTYLIRNMTVVNNDYDIYHL